MTGSQLTPNIRLIDPTTGLLTAEGFRFFQAITQAVNAGGTFQPISSILTGVASMGPGTGLVTQVGATTFNKRTLTGSSPILITNGNGVAGDPTFTGDIASNAEAIAGVDTTKIIVPSSLAAALASAGGAYQPLDADLTALAANSTDGLWAHTGAGTGAARNIAGTSPVQVSNPAGIAGNPTISVDASTTTASGIVELATSAETITGTDTVRAVTPAGAAAAYPLATSGTWTPALTFATVGNLVVVYSWQIGEWYRFGNVVTLFFTILTSTFTHTTAAGGLQITGLPVAAKTLANMRWNGSLGQVQGITKATYTQFMAGVNSGASLLTITASGSGVATGPVVFTDVPTGGTLVLAGTVSYSV